MAKLRKAKTKDATKKKRGKKGKVEIQLPLEHEEASGSLDDFSFLIHGEKKIGKTTLALETLRSKDRVLVLQCDPPQRAYRRLEVLITAWPIFKAALRELEKMAKKDYPYCRVVVDRVDLLYRMCFKWVCDSRGIDHPQDEAWGAGYDAIRKEFADAIDRLLRLPGGRWFICHSAWRDIELRGGGKTTKLLPTMPKQAEDVLNGKVDCWFAYDYKGADRILIVQGDERTGAGHRLDRDMPHFRSVNDKPLRSIRMGNSSKAAFTALRNAFDNTYVPAGAPPKKGKKGIRIRKG
jgi:hypothetical protein